MSNKIAEYRAAGKTLGNGKLVNLQTDSNGVLLTNDQASGVFTVAALDNITDGIAISGDSTDGLAIDVDHRGRSDYSVEFDKISGTPTYARVENTITAIDISNYDAHALLGLWIYLSDLTDVASVSVLLGTSSSHHNVYTIADSLLTTGWQHIHFPLGSPTSQTGNGADFGAITYYAISVTFDANTDTLADIRIADLVIEDSGQTLINAVGTDGGAQVTEAVAIGGNDGSNFQILKVNSDGELIVNLEAADIEIGAVELKNAATDDRALISDADTARATTDHVLSVQQIGADGTVPPTGSLVTNAPFVKVGDGTETLLINTSGSAGVDLTDIDGNAVDVGAGAVGTGTLRQTLASDDPAVVALQVIDDWDESDRAKVNPIAGQAGVAAAAGAVDALTQRVTLASDDPAVVDLAAIEVVNTAIQTAVEVMDDWDESDRAKVNPIVGQAGVAANAGAADALTQRVILASDDPAVVDLAAIELLNTDIKTAVEIMDDWDESDRAKVNPIVGQAGVAAGSGANGATVQRVTVATDDTVATDLTAIKTAVEILDDWDETDRAAVNLISGQAAITGGAGAVAANSPRVTLASDDPAVTALQIIDDWDATQDSGVASDGPQIMVEARSARGTAVASGDAVRPTSNIYGELVNAGYNWSGNSNRVEEVDPLDQKYVAETLFDVTDGTDGTYYYYVDMAGFQKSAYQLILSGGSGTVTVTVEASMQDDGTAPASCVYADVTNAVFGAASFTATNYLVDDAGILASAKYVRIKVVASTGAADDADWTGYHKRWY